MSDGNRIYPVYQYVIHHTGSTGTDFVGWTDQDIQDWFDRVGKERGYAGVPRSYHLHPSRDKETFAQYQLALIPNGNADAADTDWRVIPLMRDGWENVAWGAGNWAVNQVAMNICIAGDRTGRPLNKKALYRLAEFWQPQDKQLSGNTIINPHAWVSQSSTSCPAAVIPQVETVIEYVNDLDKAWREIFADPKYTETPANRSIRFEMSATILMYNFMTMEVVAESGWTIDITGSTTIINGETWYIPVDRMPTVNEQPYGFRESDIFGNSHNVIEPIPEPKKDIWQVKVNFESFYKGTDESLAVAMYQDIQVSEENRMVELIKNDITQESKAYSAPRSVYYVYAGDKMIFEGYDRDAAYILYNNTVPTESTKVVQIMSDDYVLDRKIYKEPEAEQDLLEWILELLNKLADWLKGWKRNG